MLRLSPQMLIAAAGCVVRSNAPIPDHAAESRPSDDAPAQPANVRFIQHCGHWSHFDYRMNASSWPIPDGLTVHELGLFGLAHDILYPMPEPGDIFLQFGPSRKTFVRAGIIVVVLDTGRLDSRAPYFDVYTLEAVTQERTRRVRRRLSPGMNDRFLRWAELDAWHGRRVGGGIKARCAV